ncbi:hypothetical protein JOF56_006256 [Kibdelosporangium banguiense]|uniref:Uncharacterized protein n=1 Tax=Kibdelosporangium banguiense TaxID=1365924 RepID=A0ABS4TPM5_9PSEU|nr:hypothetical protein [Kibdelosporangium banguiense]MBP2325871.1 hypothetical protein [Kibdelosporangium banguiense]
MRSPVWIGQAEQGVVAAAGPGGAVGGGEQRVDFGVGEVGDDGLVVAFGGDGQDAVDVAGVFGVVQCGEAEQ